MDRFRFRVWNNKIKEFVDQMDWSYWDLCFWYEPYNEDKESVLMDIGDKHIPEQCTGLKDKNGNLIYEGDIVNTSNFGKCFIEWADDEAGFTLHSIETVNYYSIYCCNDFEIIGNIHENPELLEE